MGPGQSGADGIDVDHVGHVEYRVLVVDQPARNAYRTALVVELDPLRSKQSEMQPDRR